MDRVLWKTLTAATRRAARKVKCSVRKPEFSDYLIVTMYFWSVWHDRCMSWACDKSHYGDLFRPRRLPSISQFTRRVKTDSCQRILQLVHQDLTAEHRNQPLMIFDGKPLPVSPVSKDRDARSGHVRGGFAKGYKLHAVATQTGRIILWSVMPLNVAEQTVAMELMAHVPHATDFPTQPMTLADSNYDSSDLYAASARCGRQLLSPLKGQRRVKNGQHHPVTLRQMSPARRQSVQIWQMHASLAQLLLKQRVAIERIFGTLTSFGGGLGPLPSWVRGLDRVRRWVGAKIIVYHVRLAVSERAAA